MTDLYHIWCDLKDRREDKPFAKAVAACLNHYKFEGLRADWRMTHRKLGPSPDWFGEFHIIVDTETLAQLDAALQIAARRTVEVERLHANAYARAAKVCFALYRDWPDA